MVRLMIVDDEQIVRDGIKFIVDHHFKDTIEIVGMAKSGREAIELHQLKRPDIILMDIQMPGISGIEAIEAIKNMDLLVKFVIISAYEQFEYAKKAVELGVNDYILKPINKQKLIDVLETIISDIHKAREVRLKEIETQEKLDKVIPVLEQGYIYSILLNNDYQKENSDYQSLLGTNKDQGFIMVIDFGEGDSPALTINKIGNSVKSTLKYESIRHAIKYKVKAVVGPLIVNRLVILVYEDMPEDEYKRRIKAIELGENLQKKLSGVAETNVHIGIGSCHKNHRLNLSYQEAVRALGRMSGESVLHIDDTTSADKKTKAYDFYKIKNDEDQLLKLVEDGNEKELLPQLKLFLNKIERDYSDQLEVVKNIALELMVLVYNCAYRQGVYESSVKLNYVEEIESMTSFRDIKQMIMEQIVTTSETIGKEKENKVSNVIGDAMKYIDLHYAKDLRLKEVAEVVAISPQYFSKIFKEELGVNFIDYLTKVRMTEAKKLLKQKELSIKEICYHIGYNDPNYFSRLFKKVEGISPTDYIG